MRVLEETRRVDAAGHIRVDGNAYRLELELAQKEVQLYIARKLIPNSINYKLGTLAKLFNINYEGAHRGLKDVEITYELYNNLRKLK